MSKVLIAEDDLMIADFLEEILLEAGYTVCGIATTVAEAVRLGNVHQPDLAILDIRLGAGGLGTDIVPLLTSHSRVGILYASGSGIDDLKVAHGDVGICKPYATQELLKALEIVQQIVDGTAIALPVPVGVHVL